MTELSKTNDKNGIIDRLAIGESSGTIAAGYNVFASMIRQIK